MRFNDTKSETLNLRVSPLFKLALREAADHEHRSMVNMLEVLLGEYCERTGILLANQKVKPAPSEMNPHPKSQIDAGAVV